MTRLNRKSKVYTAIILLYPILSQYVIISEKTNIGFMVLLSYCFYLILTNNTKKSLCIDKVNLSVLFFIFYIIFVGLLVTMLQEFNMYSTFIYRSLYYLFYLIVFVLFTVDYFNFNYFIKLYNKLVKLVIAFFVIQMIMFYFFDTPVLGRIPFLEVSNPGYSDEKMYNLYNDMFRPSSIFLEPAHLAQFLLPYLAHLLFGTQTKDNIMKDIFCTTIVLTTIVLSTSGQGILISFLLIVFWLFKKILYERKVRNFTLGISLFLILIALLPVITKLPILERSLGRLFGSENSSANSRIYHGFDIFKQISVVYKIFGVGFGNIGLHMSEYNIYTLQSFGKNQAEYMNSVAYILNNLGFFGLIIWMNMMYKMSRRTSLFSKMVLLVTVILSMVSTIFISGNIIVYLSIVRGDTHEKKNSYNVR